MTMNLTKQSSENWQVWPYVNRLKMLAKLREMNQPVNKRPKLTPPEFRGMALQAFTDQSPEIILSGPAGTGKSFAILWKLHYLCATNKNVRALIVRKTRESLTESALVTFENQVLGGDSEISNGAARDTRKVYRYPTGSEIIVAGLVQSRQDQRAKIMSTEYDIIYPQEAIELTLNDWEQLTTRLRNGRLPYQQIIGDTNPDSPSHWIWSRGLSGRTKLLNSRHEDNPRLHDGQNWTEYGRSLS